ncbi:hypothetical protein [Vibrio metschnikovii]|uniref:hypothetical protein n=1 Tax=Vibrio metschnikovii TaxID=28172 RepID=UPI001C30ED4C|nr:hypothetical protein [Vibrio metschnikovii]
MTTNTQSKSRFIKLPTGDALDIGLIGSCSHYKDHGIMILGTNGDKLLYIPQPDNAKAIAIRDEIVEALMS